MLRPALATCLVVSLGFEAPPLDTGEHGVVDTSCHEEDLDTLEFSLLQTAVSLRHDDVPQSLAQVFHAHPLQGPAHEGQAQQRAEVPARAAELEVAATAAVGERRLLPSNSSYNPRAAYTRQSSLVAMLNAWERFDTGAGPHLAGGVPMILLFMVAFLIGAVFVIQVVSIATEPKEAEPPVAASLSNLPLGRRRQDRGPRYPAAVPTTSLLQPGTGSERESFASQVSGFSPMYPQQDMPAPSPATHRASEGGLFPMPRSAGGPGVQRSRDFYPPPGTYQPPEGSGAALETPFSRTTRTDASLEASRLPDAICPALILPHAEAQFCLTLESLRRLSAGRCPVQILGPSRKPLLHARLPAAPPGAPPASGGGGGASCWLELSTTATTKYPHACVGPLRLPGAEGGGGGGRQLLEIRGPRGDNYGTLEQSGSGWSAMHGGRMVLFINIAPQGNALTATSMSSNPVATANLIPGVDAAVPGRPTSEADGPALKVQVQPGIDALLYLLCMLAVVLVAPELAALRSGEALGRFSGPGASESPGSMGMW